MRVKISVTLPEGLLNRIDQFPISRSALIERACRCYIARLREANDIQIVQAHAHRLNKGAMDVIGYQRLPG